MLNVRLPLPRLFSAGEVFFDRGSIGVLRALNAGRIAIIVSGSFFKNDEAMRLVRKALANKEHVFLPVPTGEPSVEKLNSLILSLSAYRPDWIVAIGGGSAIDSAKIAWVFYEHPDLDLNRATSVGGIPSLRGKARFIAVPTTSGTGSEVSSAAVFFDASSSSKKVLISHDLLPDIAVLDPELAQFTPTRVTAISGLDALAHAVEGYVSRFKNPFLDLQAEKAVGILFRCLEKCVKNPLDLSLRMEMMSAALMAGWVQNSKIPGIGHAIAHQMSTFAIPHGHACGILLSASIGVNSADSSVRARYEQLARRTDVATSISDFQKACRGLVESVGLEVRLSQACPSGRDGIESRRVEIITGALGDICARANPIAVTESLVTEALEASL